MQVLYKCWCHRTGWASRIPQEVMIHCSNSGQRWINHTKEQTEKCLNSLQILKNNLGTEVFSFSNLFFCFLMHSHHHQISILHWAELTQTHAWRSSYVCWLLWAVSTCLSLRRSPVFLRSFMLTYQSHTYSFSAAAEKTRPCRDQNWTCSLSSAAPLL